MAIRWDLHREVLGRVGRALKYMIPRVIGALLFASIMVGATLLLGPMGMVMVLTLAVVCIWYWGEYREAKRRDDLRKRSGGMCG